MTPPAHVGPAVSFRVVEVFRAHYNAPLMSEAPSNPPSAETRRKATPIPPRGAADAFGPWLRENAEAVVVAFIMALVIRCFFLEVFKIPTSSMEPSLLGDFSGEHFRNCPFKHYHSEETEEGNRATSPGDRIMVNKFFYALREVGRYDVAVFRFPLRQSQNFIKRVVGLPEEELFLLNGNVFVRPMGEDEFTVARKPPHIQDSIWIDIEEHHDLLTGPLHPGDRWNAFSGGAGYSVLDGKLTTREEDGNRDIRLRYDFPLLPSSAPFSVDEFGEIRFAATVELHGTTGRFLVELENAYGAFTLILAPGAPAGLRRKTESGAIEVGPISPTPTPSMRPFELDFQIYDGLVSARVDGVPVIEQVLFSHPKEAGKYRNFGRPRVHVEGDGLLFTLSTLSLQRDIFYRGSSSNGSTKLELEGRHHALKIGPENFFMMGDNVEHSHDSRGWRRREFRLQDGTTVVCENANFACRNSGSEYRDILGKMESLLPEGAEPDVLVEADHLGRPGWFDLEEIHPEDRDGLHDLPPSAPFIDRRDLIGRAFLVFWPPKRLGRIIR